MKNNNNIIESFVLSDEESMQPVLITNRVNRDLGEARLVDVGGGVSAFGSNFADAFIQGIPDAMAKTVVGAAVVYGGACIITRSWTPFNGILDPSVRETETKKLIEATMREFAAASVANPIHTRSMSGTPNEENIRLVGLVETLVKQQEASGMRLEALITAMMTQHAPEQEPHTPAAGKPKKGGKQEPVGAGKGAGAGEQE